jgi:hypothetical protein
MNGRNADGASYGAHRRAATLIPFLRPSLHDLPRSMRRTNRPPEKNGDSSPQTTPVRKIDASEDGTMPRLIGLDQFRGPPSDSVMPDGDRDHYRPNKPFGKMHMEALSPNGNIVGESAPRVVEIH